MKDPLGPTGIMEDKINNDVDAGPSSSTGAIKKKKDEKRIKRDQRSWDNLVKNIGSLSYSEKFDYIKEKYTELYLEFRSTVSTLKATEKQMITLQREKDHVKAELAKNILSRSKMESLARELQKQNKEIKDENYNRLKEEEEKRREVASSFTEKLSTLTLLMDENRDKSLHLHEENMNMTNKLSELYDQFQERENRLTNMGRQMDLQKKLSDTQLKKVEVEFETEREIWQKERAMLVANLQRSDETNKVLQENVKSLQEHLDSYQKQYSDFEFTMKRSNQVFDSFKDEMTKMQKANASMEKDRNDWHTRWQNSTQTVLHLTDLQQKGVADLRNAQKKISMLEKLCRKLQVERAAYLQQLKDNKVNPVTPTAPAEEEITSATSSTSSLSLETIVGPFGKEKELIALKKELKKIEDQMKQKAKEKTDSSSIDNLRTVSSASDVESKTNSIKTSTSSLLTSNESSSSNLLVDEVPEKLEQSDSLTDMPDAKEKTGE
ncbi:unnamed protein product [Phaedon cochleariae]|uniref:Alpha-taxilin n=1 Tax=Phaedon cochleariae TaxID=80249 RepID=A0A9P0DFS2_PHACE|nr:unnamed protein product [Phaedon cochleariae]